MIKLLTMGLIFLSVAHAETRRSTLLEHYLGAIDLPMTAFELRDCGATLDALASIANEDKHRLYVRVRAVAAIGIMSEPNALETLRHILDTQRDEGIRVEAVYAIAALSPAINVRQLNRIYTSSTNVSTGAVLRAITLVTERLRP